MKGIAAILAALVGAGICGIIAVLFQINGQLATLTQQVTGLTTSIGTASVDGKERDRRLSAIESRLAVIEGDVTTIKERQRAGLQQRDP